MVCWRATHDFGNSTSLCSNETLSPRAAERCRLVVDPRRRARQLPYDEIAMTSERSRLLELSSGWRSHSDAQRRQSYVAPIACHMYRGSLPRSGAASTVGRDGPATPPRWPELFVVRNRGRRTAVRSRPTLNRWRCWPAVARRACGNCHTASVRRSARDGIRNSRSCSSVETRAVEMPSACYVGLRDLSERDPTPGSYVTDAGTGRRRDHRVRRRLEIQHQSTECH